MIYLITSLNNTYMKVGYSKDFKNTIKRYKRCNPEFKVIGVIENGEVKDESYYHIKYSTNLIDNREWMLYNEELVNEFKSNENFKEYIDDTKNIRFAFKFVFKDVIKSIENNSFDLDYSKEEIECIHKAYPFLSKAIDKLGVNVIKQLKYNITNIKFKLTTIMDVSDEVKIIKLLKNKVKVGEFKSNKDLKEIISNIYNKLNKGNGKASDIKKYYNVKETKKKINDKLESGYIIVNPKIIIK